MNKYSEVIHSKFSEVRKSIGLFLTPDDIVELMVSLIEEPTSRNYNILEPACGLGQFLRKIKEIKPDIFLNALKKTGVEINTEIAGYARELCNAVSIINKDYLLWQTTDKYDIIIGNPPYGIPSPSKHYAIRTDKETKAKYKKLYETWFGKYNMYGAFMEKSVKLLRENGQLIFIVPSTFLLIDDFKKLRKFLANSGKTEILYLGNDVFKPEADINTVIIKFRKSSYEKKQITLYDYSQPNPEFVCRNNNWNGEVVLFKDSFSQTIEQMCSFRLGDLYEIKISPRTTEIRNNPYVHKQKIRKSVPILNGKNLKIGRVIYEPFSGYWLEYDKRILLKKFFAFPRIVVGLGFRGKGQLGAAYDHKAYPWMGDVYHLIPKNTFFSDEFNLNEQEVIDFLNSDIMSRYIKTVFKDITYHFNITQLKLLPLPTKKQLEKIMNYGRNEELA